MRKKLQYVKIFWLCFFVISVVFLCSGCKKNKTSSEKLSMTEKQVSINYRDVVYLPEYFGENDNFSNAELYNPSNEIISLKDGNFYADTLGTYQLVLHESQCIYKLEVQDLTGPIVRLEDKPFVHLEDEVSITDIALIDNLDTEFDTENLTYSVKKRGMDVEVSDGMFTAAELGEYVVEFDVADKAGNPAEAIMLTCEMPKVIVKPVGTKIQITDDIFKGLIDEDKTYQYETEIHKVTKSDSTSVSGQSITIGKDSVFVVSQTASCGDETITLDYMYRPENLLIYNFDNQDMSVLAAKSQRSDMSSKVLLQEIEEGNYAALLKVPGGGTALNISGLEPNTTYDTVMFDVNCLLSSAVDDALKLSFYNASNYKNGHSIVRDLNTTQKVVYTNITTDGLGIATVYLFAHGSEGETEFTIDNLVVKKIPDINVAKGVYMRFTGTADVVEKGNGAYSIMHLDVMSTGICTWRIYATKEAGLKPNTTYLVSVDVVCDGNRPSFYSTTNSFILGGPGGKANFTVKTDANGNFELAQDTIYLNTTNKLSYVEFTGVEMTQYEDGQIVTGKDSVYGEGITITPSRIDNGALFLISEKTNEAGKKYNGIATISRWGYSHLTLAATKAAGLKPNSEYQVTIDVECDGNYPAYYDDSSQPSAKFILGNQGGKITFIVKTDENGAFSHTWKNVYLNQTNKLSYVDFVGVSFVYNQDAEVATGEDSVYGAGVSVIPSRIDGQARFLMTLKTGKDGKTYNGIGNIKQGAYSKLTVAATQEAGLKANKQYLVTVDVECDGDRPAYFDDKTDANAKFIFGNPGGQIIFKITTDANGAFTKTWDNVWINQGQGITYVDYTGIDITLYDDEDIATGEDSVYGEGVSVIPSRIDGQAKFLLTQKTDETGKTYNGIGNIEQGAYSKLTVAATQEAGLKRNKEYLVTVEVECDGTYPAYFDDKTDANTKFILGNPGGKITFSVVTDDYGAFTKVWDNVWINQGQGITYVDFTGIEIKLKYDDAEVVTGSDSVYGTGVTVVASRSANREIAPSSAYLAEFVLTQKTNENNKKYNGIGNITRGGYHTLSVSADAEAGLLPNKEYKVVLDVECDGTYPAYFDDKTDANAKFIFGNPGGQITFYVTTDANGTFTKVWDKVYINLGQGITAVDFTGIMIELNETVYGNGISIAPTTLQLGGYNKTDKIVADGEHAGEKYTSITNTSTRDDKISIFHVELAATADAGLKANAEYIVTVDVACDGNANQDVFLHNAGNKEFKLKNPGGQITFKVTTDANGAFSKVWTDVWMMNGITYVDFTGITFELHETVYGRGVSIAPTTLQLGAYEQTDKTVVSGENAGKKYTSITNTSTRSDKISIFHVEVAATTEAGLQANTEYSVTVDVSCDGNANQDVFLHNAGNKEFKLRNPGGQITFTVTTDANGAFSKVWTDVWMMNGITYVDFTNIQIAPKQ